MIIDLATEFADLLVPWAGARLSAGTDDAEGNYVPGTSVPFTIRATPCQPLTQNELQMVEGGSFDRSIVKTYTADTVLNSDLLTYNGIQYKVMQFDDRQPLGTYQKVYLVKVQNDN